MKNKKLKYISISLFIILIFIFTYKYNHPNYKKSTHIKTSFQEILYEYDDFNDELPVNISKKSTNKQKADLFISKYEAEDDIDYLFSILKFGYSAYSFFGGDEVFLQAKENILLSIENLNTELIHKDTLLEIILSNLDFIQDSHFIVEDYKLCDYTKYFSTDKYIFHKDGKGYYSFLDDKKVYLKEINNEDISCYMKKSLDKDGYTIYNLGILSNTKNVSVPLELLLTHQENSFTKNISLFEYIPIYEDQNKSYRYSEVDNIPFLKLQSLYATSVNDSSIEDFLKDSKKLKSKDEFIIDLRGNIGGSMINVEKWLEGFTGRKLQKDIVEAGLYTDTSITLAKKKFESKKNEGEEVKNICLDKIDSYKDESFFPGWSSVKYSKSKAIKNETNIVILVDKETASAAEFLVHYLRKLENVTIIGTLTNGCVLTGNCNMTHLANSNIQIHVSHKIYMNEELNNIDGFGIIPDYWVKPGNSMDIAIKYLKNKK